MIGDVATLPPLAQETLDNERLNQWARDTARRQLADQQAEREWTPPASVSLADFLASTPDPLLYRVADLHVAGHNSLLAAQYKSGKTTLFANLVRSLVDGVDFLGRKTTPTPGRVAVWNFEVDEAQMHDWFTRLGVEHRERAEVLNLRGRKMPLYNDRTQAWVIDWLRDNEITSWLVDPAVKLLVGWPGAREVENSNSAVTEVTDILDAIKLEAGVHDLFVAHHTGRGTTAEGDEHGRGATRWDDWPDARWILTKKRNTQTGDTERFFYAQGRGVDIGEHRVVFDPTTYRLDFAEGSRSGDRVDSDVDAVIAAVEQVGDGSPTRTVTDAMPIKESRKASAIVAAEEAGLIVRKQVGRAKCVFLTHARPRPDLSIIDGLVH